MTDVVSPAKRSQMMSGIKGKNSLPEMLVRKALFAMGYRFRLHRRDLPGTPDIAMPGRRIAIFVHGCFWHGHDCARGARMPKANAVYWAAKIARNRVRDAAAREELTAMGWDVLTIWECEMKRDDLESRLRGFVCEGAP